MKTIFPFLLALTLPAWALAQDTLRADMGAVSVPSDTAVVIGLTDSVQTIYRPDGTVETISDRTQSLLLEAAQNWSARIAEISAEYRADLDTLGTLWALRLADVGAEHAAEIGGLLSAQAEILSASDALADSLTREIERAQYDATEARQERDMMAGLLQARDTALDSARTVIDSLDAAARYYRNRAQTRTDLLRQIAEFFQNLTEGIL